MPPTRWKIKFSKNKICLCSVNRLIVFMMSSFNFYRFIAPIFKFNISQSTTPLIFSILKSQNSLVTFKIKYEK